MQILAIIFSSMFLSNILLNKMIGFPSLEEKQVSLKKVTLLGVFTLILSVLSTLILYPIYNSLLIPSGWEFLHPILSVLVVALLFVIFNLIASKLKISTYEEQKEFTPLIAFNAIIIDISLVTVANGSLALGLSHALGLSLGYIMVLLLIFTIKPRLDLPGGPKAFKGAPILLVTLGLIGMIFLGLAGIF